MPSGVDSVRDGRFCTFKPVHFPVFFCRLASFNCFFFAPCSSRHWAPSREPSNKLGLKKQRVVDVVTDAWPATAGLRGGQILEARALTCTSPATISQALPPLGLRVLYVV